MGDIFLTTPIISTLRKNYPDAVIDFYTKSQYTQVMEDNPDLSSVYSWEYEKQSSLNLLFSKVSNRSYDHIFDLQNNWRSRQLSSRLYGKKHRVNKERIRRRLLVYFKWNTLRKRHVIDRYYALISDICNIPLKRKIDHSSDENPTILHLNNIAFHRGTYLVWAIGAKQFTKRLPNSTVAETLRSIPEKKIVLIGDHTDSENAKKIKASLGNDGMHVIDFTGKTTYQESTQLIQHAGLILTNDSIMMHVAAASGNPMISFWGSTVPEFGFAPLSDKSTIISAPQKFSCRPCHTSGRSSCPKKHFGCMTTIEPPTIVAAISDGIKMDQ